MVSALNRMLVRYPLTIQLNRFVGACQAASRTFVSYQSSRLVYARNWHECGRYMELYDLKSRDDADRSILTTWTLSFDHVRAQSEEAANLLPLSAFLDNQDLWYGLFAPILNHEVFKVPNWYDKCVLDESDFKDCLTLLWKYSFIDVEIESSSFSIHPVFHRWCYHAFEEDKDIMSQLAMTLVVSAVPPMTMPDYSLIQRRLLPHCDLVFSLAQQRMRNTFIDKIDLQWQCYAYHILGALYMDQDRLKKTEDMYLQTLEGKEKVLGAEHIDARDSE